MYEDELNPRELHLILRDLFAEVRGIRREVNELIQKMREAEYVHKRFNREHPGFWEESVRLEAVRQKIGDAL